MSNQSPPQQRLSAEAAQAVYERTSRRGVLARASAVLMGFGVGSALQAAPAAADASSCCTGTNCKSLGAGCPGIGLCSPGWSYTGYTWVCCSGPNKVYCSDCRTPCASCQGGYRNCACTYRTREPCTSALTATEVSARLTG
jgi:hypothetical protein